MQLQNGTTVFVTDGRKALFLCNQGDAEFADLRVTEKWDEPMPSDRELKTDSPGHVFSSRGGSARRSAYDEGDYHEQAETRFAERVANFINEQANGDGVDELVLVAPPRTLGVIRKHLHTEVARKVAAEIPKDLVNRPVSEIERLIAAYCEPS